MNQSRTPIVAGLRIDRLVIDGAHDVSSRKPLGAELHVLEWDDARDYVNFFGRFSTWYSWRY